jgi:hypothetical protein
MKGLTTTLLSRACRTFLTLAYPNGVASIPPAKAAYFDLDPALPLEALLAPPLCQAVPAADGRVRGYALRLGSAHYPHLKMQVIDCDQTGTWVFGVDTHDCLRLEPGHPDYVGWLRLQAANRQLKDKIEQAWAAVGLLTFPGLLRRDLDRAACPPAPAPDS